MGGDLKRRSRADLSRDEKESANMRLSSLRNRKKKNKEKRTDPQRHAGQDQTPTEAQWASPKERRKRARKNI